MPRDFAYQSNISQLCTALEEIRRQCAHVKRILPTLGPDDYGPDSELAADLCGLVLDECDPDEWGKRIDAATDCEGPALAADGTPYWGIGISAGRTL